MTRSTYRTIETNKTKIAFDRLYTLAALVFTGKKTLQMFCSVPGLGKTEAVLRCGKKLGLELHYASPTTVAGFCMDLWANRDRSYFLDDVDTLASSEPCANIAKMAFGTQRLVNCPTTKGMLKNEEFRLSGDERYDPAIPQPSFKLGPTFGLLWNTNKNFTDPSVIDKDMAPHFAALVSRGLDPLWIPNDPQSLFDYTLWMIVGKGMLRGFRIGDPNPMNGGFSAEHVNDTIQFFCKNALRLKEISPRMAWKLCQSRRVDPDYQLAWREQITTVPRWRIELPDKIPHVGKNRPADWDQDED
jgi:hypothetical protein